MRILKSICFALLVMALCTQFVEAKSLVIEIKDSKKISAGDKTLLEAVKKSIEKANKALGQDDAFKDKKIIIDLDRDKDSNAQGDTEVTDGKDNEVVIRVNKKFAEKDVDSGGVGIIDRIIAHELEHAKVNLPKDSKHRQFKKKLADLIKEVEKLGKSKKDKLKKAELIKQFDETAIETKEYNLAEEKRIMELSKTEHDKKLKFDPRIKPLLEAEDKKVIEELEKELEELKKAYKKKYGVEYKKAKGKGICSIKPRCSDLSQCAQAQFYYSMCALRRLDGDRDGIPCENLCKTAAEEPAEPRECGEKTTCREMTGCADALFHFNQCGVERLDGDNDGVPCEILCGS